jgi:putative transposase
MFSGRTIPPTSQGKIERWQQTLKNQVLLENYFLSDDLKMRIGDFIDHYDNHRFHASILRVRSREVSV